MSPDFDFIIERLEASLHTSSPPAQVNHRQYHCFHHQAEAYAIYDTFGVTWWTNFQLMEVKPTVSQISNNCKWCHLVAKQSLAINDANGDDVSNGDRGGEH